MEALSPRPMPSFTPRELGAAVVVASVLFAQRWQQLMTWAAIGEALADQAQPFERPRPDAPRRVLVVGDSTGVGTGASDPAHSIAGRLAADFPDAHVVNRARNGAKTLDVCRQLDACRDERYDVVLVHTGGNDVLRGTPWPELVRHVEMLLARATRIGRHVVVTTTPNVGLCPAFFAPLSWWLTHRSRRLRDLFAKTCRRHGAHYANFFHPRARCPFSREWERYFAADRLHPSSECYAYVYATLLRATPLAHWLTASAPPDLGAHVDQLGEEGHVERLAQEAYA